MSGPAGQARAGVADSAVLAGAGGILDAFTYLGHGHVFANAMTGNVVLLGVTATQGDWHQAFRHLLPTVSFILGIATAKAFYLPQARLPRNPSLVALTLEIIILGMVGCLPTETADYWITISVAFAASFQTTVFRSVDGYSYNSTFMTGNLRTFSESMFAWLIARNSDSGRKVRTFAIICGSFFLGSLGGSLLTPQMHNKTLWVVCFMLAVLPCRAGVNYRIEALRDSG